MKYWQLVVGRAWRESLAAVRWENKERIVIALLIAVGTFGGTWLWTGDVAVSFKALAAVSATTLILFTYASLKMLSVPVAMHNEISAELATVKTELERNTDAQKPRLTLLEATISEAPLSPDLASTWSIGGADENATIKMGEGRGMKQRN